MENDRESDLAVLMEGYQKGKLECFEALYGLLKPRLFQYLLFKTRNRGHAEDLTQETFLQIHRSRHTYLSGRSVGAWTFAIARYVFLMDRRSRLRRTQHETAETEAALASLQTVPEITDLADRDLLRRGLQKVPEKRREPLLLHHVWGFSFQEVAAILGIRRSAAKVRAFRGMKNLREAIQQLQVTRDKAHAK